MSRRAEELASELDHEFAQIIDLIAGLTPDHLVVPCDDSQGATVGAVLLHLRDGTHLVVDWAAGLSAAGSSASGTPNCPSGHVIAGDGHSDPHSHDHHSAASHDAAASDVIATVDTLRDGGRAFVAAIRALSDEQLESYPPAVTSLTDGTVRLDRLCTFIAEDLAAHRSHLERAVAGSVLQDRM